MKNEIKGSLMWGGGILALALAASWARGQGLIDADTTTRVVLCAIGLMVAWMGNRLPKGFVPGTGARAARRVAGWSLAISGLISAAAFAFAPLALALPVGGGAVMLGIAVTFGYCLSLRNRATAV